jgi:MoaA/NifB/PqqE/SkfB family radical SAM enzyme
LRKCLSQTLSHFPSSDLNANLRARAYAVTGDLWESDPACYLTDEEIGS